MALPVYDLDHNALSNVLPSSEPTTEAARETVLHTYKRGPVEMARGEGVYLIDADGNRYLDFVSGIAVNALGYSDAGLVGTMQSAAEGLLHTSNLYWTAPAARLAAALTAKSFASKVFFCNSG